MTKATTKTVAVKKAPAKKTVIKPKTSSIEKVSEEILAKLKALDIEHQLQADIEWCIGSYHADKNPIGLFDMINRALPILKTELARKTKGVTAKLITNLEQVLKTK